MSQSAYRSLSTFATRQRPRSSKVVLGQGRAVELMLVAALARGHVLLEGPPGSAKTLLGRAIAYMLGASFSRIQFTRRHARHRARREDTSMRFGEQVFMPGVVFTNVLLADEINRTPAEDAGRSARGDAGAPGDRRGSEPQAQGPVPRDRDAELLRARRRLSASPSPSSTASSSRSSSSTRTRAPSSRCSRLPHDGLRPDMIADIRPLLGVVGLEKARYELNSTNLPERGRPLHRGRGAPHARAARGGARRRAHAR